MSNKRLLVIQGKWKTFFTQKGKKTHKNSLKTLERDQQQAKTKGDLTHLWSRENVVKRDQPENGLDVSIGNKDYKVLVTNVFKDL